MSANIIISPDSLVNSGYGLERNALDPKETSMAIRRLQKSVCVFRVTLIQRAEGVEPSSSNHEYTMAMNVTISIPSALPCQIKLRVANGLGPRFWAC